MEQGQTEMLFQLLDARGDDGFGDADLARRVSKALRLRHPHERFDAENQVHPTIVLEFICRPGIALIVFFVPSNGAMVSQPSPISRQTAAVRRSMAA